MAGNALRAAKGVPGRRDLYTTGHQMAGRILEQQLWVWRRMSELIGYGLTIEWWNCNTLTGIETSDSLTVQKWYGMELREGE